MWRQVQASRFSSQSRRLLLVRSGKAAAAFECQQRFLSAASKNKKAPPKPFDKVLIANRGEIAQRVMRTCHEMGIETVAVYSTADVQAPFVEMATERVCIGPAASQKSYLNTANVLQALRMTGAQAVHPGYGFMSENSTFAQQVTDMGVAWLGPSPHAVEAMGDKLRSKQLALQAGVSIIPGFDGPMADVNQALEVANDIGYPVLLKAASGGGGKGMRVCRNDQDMKEAFPMATAEAEKFFNDPRCLVEKYIDHPHHIEFQVMSAPKKGGKEGELDILVFAERECSIQRRHQKIIEESPSTLLTEETRQAMVAQVKALVQQVGYTSAGTVEWLVDEHQNFFFLEMNTRLQVEHPVTELVSGIDLVKAMLYVGAGWGIPPEALEALGDNYRMPHKGHAVEARVYAEDPIRGFLPSTGPLVPYREPRHLPGIRIDSGVREGHVVSPHYDPMLSKIISYSETSRTEAIDQLAKALDEYVIEGVQHNARLVNDVLRHPAFMEGKTPTSFLPTHYPEGFHGVQLSLAQKEELAVAMAQIQLARPTQGAAAVGSQRTMVVRLGGMFGEAYRVSLDHTTSLVQSLTTEGAVERSILWDSPLDYDLTSFVAHASLDGNPRAIQVIRENATGEMSVQMYGAEVTVIVQSPREYELSAHMHEPLIVDTSDMIISPMPGALIKYAVAEGDQVEIGQELCIVEAMKMQNIIRSPRRGIIGKCRVPVGSSLKADEVIVDFAPEGEESNAKAA